MSRFKNEGVSVIGIVITLVISALVVCGIYFYLDSQIPKFDESAQIRTNNEIQNQSNESINPNIPIGYKYYFNHQYGYSILYSENWRGSRLVNPFDEVENTTTFFPLDQKAYKEPEIAVMINVVKKSYSLEDIEESAAATAQSAGGKVQETINKVINGKDGYQTIIIYEKEKKKVIEFDIPLVGKTLNVVCLGKTDLYNKYCDIVINSFTYAPEKIGEDAVLDIEKWETLKNDKYKFEIKYPPTFYKIKEDESTPFSTKDVKNLAEFSNFKNGPSETEEIDTFETAYLMVNYDTRFSSIEGAKNDFSSSPQKLAIKKVTIAGLDAYKITSEVFDHIFLEWVFIKDKNGEGVYRLDFSYNSDNPGHKKMLEQMLSTFKFIQ